MNLLDHWRDFFDELASSGQSVPAEPSKPMPDDWTLFSAMSRYPSVVELRRCVEVLERLGSRHGGQDGAKIPVHHRHLLAYTAYAEWRTVDRPVKRRDARGRWVDDIERVRERVVPPWVSVRIVESAVDMILGLWRRPRQDCEGCYDGKSGWHVEACGVHARLELPPALRLKLREFTDQDGTHLTEAA